MRCLCALLCFCVLVSAQRIQIGPDIYYLTRDRDGGAKQTGIMYGGEGDYERVKPWGFYWALNGLYARGTLTGHSRTGKTESRLTDAQVEARLGYTLCWPFLLTPFVGYGYFSEINDFCDPSPIAVRFHNHFQYPLLGFRSEWAWGPYFRLGCLARVSYMVDGASEVTNDPSFDDLTLIMGPRWQYRIDLPVSLCFCNSRNAFEAAIAPFYWLRQYGGRENYPFDFIATKMRSYGARFYLSCHF